MDVLLLIVSICLIVAVADWLVAGASSMARKAGVSEFVIGMTLVDAVAIMLSCILLLIWAYTGSRCRIDRWEGALMLLCFIGYYVFLFIRG